MKSRKKNVQLIGAVSERQQMNDDNDDDEEEKTHQILQAVYTGSNECVVD